MAVIRLEIEEGPGIALPSMRRPGCYTYEDGRDKTLPERGAQAGEVEEMSKKIHRPGIVDLNGRQLPTRAKGSAPGAQIRMRKLHELQPGDAIGIPRADVPRFVEAIEEKAGGRIESLHCRHTENGVYVRYVLQVKGFACLDCMVKALNDVYPR